MNTDRRPIVAGNWKMNTTVAEARELVREVRHSLSGPRELDIVVCPPFISLVAVQEAIEGSPIALGAQNCYCEPQGAFTGEISPAMLADLGCRYVILGHSERRQHLGERDELIARKARAVLDHGMTPILCVGENLEQNEAGKTEAVIGGQVRAAIEGAHLSERNEIPKLVIAYEPIWAIGTGKAATAAAANATIRFIRQTAGEIGGAASAARMRIQYGGSVTPANAAELFAQPEIDGALVGGASLKAPDFVAICAAAAR